MANAIGKCLIGLTAIAGEHYVQQDGGTSPSVCATSGSLVLAIPISGGQSQIACATSGRLVLDGVLSGSSTTKAGTSGDLRKANIFSGDSGVVGSATGELRIARVLSGESSVDSESVGERIILIRDGAAWIIDFPDDSTYPKIVVSEAVLPTPTNTIIIPVS